MEGYVLGIDGGGTKTAVCAADMKGIVINELLTGPLNINGEPENNVRNNVMGIFQRAQEVCQGGCNTVCLGAAGVVNPKARSFLEAVVRETGYSGKLIITDDFHTALYGALEKPQGIILISGTGSVCYGINSSGEDYRTGGCGYLIDDEGSGYAIGRDILTSVIRAQDGRDSETVLTGLVFDYLRISNIEGIIKYLYHDSFNKREVAALAPLLLKACEEGDNAALKIADRCSSMLTELVIPVAEKLLLMNSELAMAGGILLHYNIIQKGFIKRISNVYPEIKVRSPQHNAAYGAVLIALENS